MRKKELKTELKINEELPVEERLEVLFRVFDFLLGEARKGEKENY